jgi:hypothetical protein
MLETQSPRFASRAHDGWDVHDLRLLPSRLVSRTSTSSTIIGVLVNEFPVNISAGIGFGHLDAPGTKGCILRTEHTIQFRSDLVMNYCSVIIADDIDTEFLQDQLNS